jgi:uncharacterized protein YegJ (DUF2314 family)
MRVFLKNSLFALTFASFVTCTHAQSQSKSISERSQKDEVTSVPAGDAAMDAAFKQARATLDDFLAKQKLPPKNTEAYAVKVGISQRGNTEYFWLGSLTITGDKFEGTINNQPRLVNHVKYGQRYAFKRAEIFDWTYIDRAERRTYGNFTACALLTREPPKEAEEFKRQMGLSCP